MREMVVRWRDGPAPERTARVAEIGVATVGRAPDCAIVLADPAVSRRHADLFCHDGAFYVRCVSQTNPVTVRRNPAPASVGSGGSGESRALGDAAAVGPGDAVSLGPGESAALGPGTVLTVGVTDLHVVAIADDAADRPIRIRCPHCQRLVAYEPGGFCPWDGTALAGGETVVWSDDDIPGIPG